MPGTAVIQLLFADLFDCGVLKNVVAKLHRLEQSLRL